MDIRTKYPTRDSIRYASTIGGIVDDSLFISEPGTQPSAGFPVCDSNISNVRRDVLWHWRIAQYQNSGYSDTGRPTVLQPYHLSGRRFKAPATRVGRVG